MILKHLVLIAIGIANVSAADDVHAAVTTEDTQTNLRATASERELVDTIATADLDVSPADDTKLTDENEVRSIGSYDGIYYDQILCLCIWYVCAYDMHILWFYSTYTAQL